MGDWYYMRPIRSVLFLQHLLNHGQRNDVIQNQDAFKQSGSSPTAPDFLVENHGSIFLLTPLTPAANSWVDEHIPLGALRWGGAIVVEHRYIADIVRGIQTDGLTVRVN